LLALASAALGLASSPGRADTVANTLATMPANSWQKVNLNQFDDVWTPVEQRPTTASPGSNVSAWSGAAWDSKRRRLVIWGGDIGDEEGNEVYYFEASTGLWRRGSLPSAITTWPNGVVAAIDGIFNAPSSGESWDNVVYLPIVDRVAVIGVSREGRTFRRPDGTATGPYFWDSSKADAGKVSGTTGSHVNPASFPGVLGGQMWQNRDNAPSDVGWALNGKTAYARENDKDVVYFAGNYDWLWRYTVDPLLPTADRWEQIGIRTLSGLDGGAAMAYDPVRRILVRPLTPTTFGFWDVGPSAISPENRMLEIVPTLLSGPMPRSAALYGIEYDPTLQAYTLWGGDDEVWLLQPPADMDPDRDGIKNSTGGWTLRRLAPTGQGPTLPAQFTGVFGKWVYLPAERAYLGVIDPDSGDVFLYKPSYSAGTPTDSTPPVITPSVVGTLGRNGWYVSDVQWSWTVQDAESTVTTQTGCAAGQLLGDTAALAVTCSASSAGGPAQSTLNLKRDATIPVARIAPLTLPAATGWYRDPVTLRTTGTDVTSGIDQCAADLVMSAEGRDQVSAPTACTDRAGNVSAGVSASGINIDRTAPVASATRTPTPNASGWNTTPVTVSFSAVDSLSGVATDGCDAAVTLETNGSGQSVTGACRDRAGNSGSATVSGISIDTRPPQAVATASRPANAQGWYNADLTVAFNATDALPGSGVASCDPDVPVAVEATGRRVAGTCGDRAGNVSPEAALTVSLDKTAPTVQIQSPTNGATFAPGQSVTIAFTCADERSGVARCESPTPNGSRLDTTTSGSRTVTVTATDRAGNVRSVSSSVLVNGSTPDITPVVVGIAGEDGWYRSNVTVNWNVAGASTVACPSGSVFYDTAGVQFGCTATNSTGTATKAVTIKRDTTAPTISVSAPKKKTRYRRGAVILARYDCADTLSGLATVSGCEGPAPVGAAIDTSTRGTKYFTVQSRNKAGLLTTKTVRYEVR
jgi:hypothetical protein